MAQTIYPLPKIHYESLAQYEETRPVALITNAENWNQLNGVLKLPIVVQAEPERLDIDFLNYLSENVPSLVEAVYVVGTDLQVDIGKIIAHQRGLPLIVVPTALDSDQMLEPHVELLDDGIITTLYTNPAERLVIDWEIIQAAPLHRRAGMVADMIAVVTGLLDWRHATKQRQTPPHQTFVPWAAGVAASLAAETIKRASEIGRGQVEALRTLLDLTSVSVQLASQLGHARQQEGTEHYLAFALEKLGVHVAHAEALGPGILLTSALHSQDPSSLRDALQKAGIRLDQVRAADIQLALQDLPTFARANDLPYSIAYEIDPFSDRVQQAMRMAGLDSDTGGWKLNETGGMAPVQQATPAQFLPNTGILQQQ